MNKLLLASMMFVLAGFASAADKPQEFEQGFEYHPLTQVQPTTTGDKIEVVELFWYGCSHCYRFEPSLHEWVSKKIPAGATFVRVPAIFNPAWAFHAQMYYTAETLGVAEKTHQPLFDAMHKERRQINTLDAAADFFAEHGVSKDDFRNTFNSFIVQSRVHRAKQLTEASGITGVPSMVVNGKYRTDGKSATFNDPHANPHEKMLEVVEALIAKEKTAVTK